MTSKAQIRTRTALDPTRGDFGDVSCRALDAASGFGLGFREGLQKWFLQRLFRGLMKAQGSSSGILALHGFSQGSTTRVHVGFWV